MRTTRTFDSEDVSLAKEALDGERTMLIMALHEIPLAIATYKRDAADAAKYGVPVPSSDTLKDAMQDAMSAIADLNANLDEWSSR